MDIQEAAEWRRLGSANVCDALRNCGRFFQAMDGGIRPLSPEMSLAGPAFTVRCYPGATWAMERALELAPRGSVLVVDGGAVCDVILMGGLMSRRAQARGLTGAVVDGAVRDVEDIVALGFPVFSRGICPRAGTFAEIGEWGTTVCCGRIPVRSGDYIVGDRTGVVVVPPEMLAEVQTAAEEIHAREEKMAVHLAKGKNFAETIEAIKRS
jgi:4-hydroxy-4-methyl-2-oxoglutarate aldolase